MQLGLRLFGLFAIVPATMLLTVSFFVLFALLKTENKALKTFGITLVVLLCLCAVMMLTSGLYLTITGHHPFIPASYRNQGAMMNYGKMNPDMMKMKCEMMKKKMMQMKDQMSSMEEPMPPAE